MSLSVSGDAAIIARLSALSQSVPKLVEEALWNEAEIIMSASKEQCPVDTGMLRGSGYVEDAKTDAAGTSVRLIYSQDYAAAVHERTDQRHAAPTKNKYLEDPAKAHAPKLVANLAARLKGVL